MKIIVIDPKRTATAELADLHLAINHTEAGDAVLFSGLMRFLIDAGAIADEWVAKHTVNVNEVSADTLQWTPSKVAEYTGLSLDDILAFYQLFEQREKTVTVYSQGVNQSVRGTDTVNSITNVHLLTGRIGGKGCGPFSITGQPNAMGGREVGGLANMLACHMDLENPLHQSLVQRYWNSPTIAKKPGLKAVDLFNAIESGQIKALWILATNPADSMPDANRVAAALEKCPFVVVSDVSSETDTSNLADVRLPALAWSEKDGTVTNSERRISRQKAFRTAPDEARADWWAVSEVAKAMGFGNAFDYVKSADVFREFAGLSEFENDGTRDFDIGACTELSDGEYESMAPFQWPRCKSGAGDSTRMFKDGGFFTENRKARFVTLRAFPSLYKEKETVETKEVPTLTLNTGRIRDQWHTMTRTGDVEVLSSHMREPFIEIHPDDAIARNIVDAALVDVMYGEEIVNVRALITDKVAPGACFVPMHWTNQFAANARINALTSPNTDPVSGQPELKSQQVQVVATEVLSYGVLISRSKPEHLSGFDYWALSPVSGGWLVEFASSKSSQEVITELTPVLQSRTVPSSVPIHEEYSANVETVSCEDSASGNYRSIFIAGSKLMHAVFLSHEPVHVERRTVIDFMSEPVDTANARLALLSGLGHPDRPNVGATVCSCLNVGKNTINASIQAGALTVDAIGIACGAGTQCGSCRSELQTLVSASAVQLKEDRVARTA